MQEPACSRIRLFFVLLVWSKDQTVRLQHNSDYPNSISYLMEDQAERYYKEGSDFFKQGHYPEALASCDKAIAINPDYADAWNGRGVALHELGRYTEAVASYDKAIAIDPDYAEVKQNRKIALKKQT